MRDRIGIGYAPLAALSPTQWGWVSHGATSYDRLSLTAGAVVTITAAPLGGYKALYRSVNGIRTYLPADGGTYSIASLSGNILYEARFGER